MVKMTRTIRQWWATSRRLEHREIGRPDLAQQIRWAFPADPNAHPDTLVTVRFVEEDAAFIEHQAPLRAWWMPVSPGWGRRPSDWGLPPNQMVWRAGEAVAAAEAIIAAHQRRGPG